MGQLSPSRTILVWAAIAALNVVLTSRGWLLDGNAQVSSVGSLAVLPATDAVYFHQDSQRSIRPMHHSRIPCPCTPELTGDVLEESLGRTQVKERSTHARPGMHMQQCSAVLTAVSTTGLVQAQCALVGPVLAATTSGFNATYKGTPS